MKIETNYKLNKYDFKTQKLVGILNFARQNFIPVALDDTINFLLQNLYEVSPKSILEIGTAVGYSGSIMLNHFPQSFLTTIELDKTNYNLAKKNFEEQNLSNKVNQILGDASEVIKDLCKENKKYDFIFLDGPKGQYLKYMPYLERLMSQNAVIFADDVLLFEQVITGEDVGHKHRAMVKKLRKFLIEITQNEKFNSKIYQIGDGVAIIKKKSKI